LRRHAGRAHRPPGRPSRTRCGCAAAGRTALPQLSGWRALARSQERMFDRLSTLRAAGGRSVERTNLWLCPPMDANPETHQSVVRPQG
jgi:hypothetical protein